MIMSDSFADATPPLQLSRPFQALWWLRKGGLQLGAEWQTAHDICQEDEGNPAYDAVHALAHWIEGDMGNAAYWYRRVSGTRAATLEAEWPRIAGLVEGL